MKRLFLLRHAKAVREDADDHKRALAARGQQDAARMGRFLAEEVYVPDIILSSDALRTVQTVNGLLPELGTKPTVKYLKELYLAEPEIILALAQRAPDNVGSVMIVGHNPGIEECATALCRSPEQKKLRKLYDAMEEKFPTCALAVIDFDVASWKEIAPDTGELDAFVRPKDLPSGEP